MNVKFKDNIVEWMLVSWDEDGITIASYDERYGDVDHYIMHFDPRLGGHITAYAYSYTSVEVGLP